jgi:hypothetical protein
MRRCSKGTFSVKPCSGPGTGHAGLVFKPEPINPAAAAEHAAVAVDNPNN